MPERCAMDLLSKFSVVEYLESRRLLSAGPHGHDGGGSSDDGAIVVDLKIHDHGNGHHDGQGDQDQQQNDSGDDGANTASWSDSGGTTSDQSGDDSGQDDGGGHHGNWEDRGWDQTNNQQDDSNEPTAPPIDVAPPVTIAPPVNVAPPVDVNLPPSDVNLPPVAVSPPHWKVSPPPTTAPPVEQPPSNPPPVDQPPASPPPVAPPPVDVTPPTNSPPPATPPGDSTTPAPTTGGTSHDPSGQGQSSDHSSSEHSAPSPNSGSGSQNESAPASGSGDSAQTNRQTTGEDAPSTQPAQPVEQGAQAEAGVVRVSLPSPAKATSDAQSSPSEAFSRVQIQDIGDHARSLEPSKTAQPAASENALDRLMDMVLGNSPYGHVHGAVAPEAMSVPVSADQIQVRSIGDLLSPPPDAQLSAATVVADKAPAPEDLSSLVRPPQQQASFRAVMDRDGAINPQNVMAALLAGVTLGAIQLHRWRKRRVEAAAAEAQKLASLLTFDPLAVWVDNPRRRRRY